MMPNPWPPGNCKQDKAVQDRLVSRVCISQRDNDGQSTG